jgi:hypothetical protein
VIACHAEATSLLPTLLHSPLGLVTTATLCGHDHADIAPGTIVERVHHIVLATRDLTARQHVTRATRRALACLCSVVVRVVLVLVVVAQAAAARADDFVWQAPASCPDADEVRARIEHRLGMPVDGSVHGIEVAIAVERGQYVAHIDTRSVTVANGPRVLTSPHCDELTDAVAVIVARLASEARLREETHAARFAPIAVHRAAPVVLPAWGGGLRALAVSGVGVVPRVGIGGELAAYVRQRNRFGELAVSRWATSASYLVDGAPGGVEIGLTAVAVRGGWSPEDKPIRTWVGIEGGEMTGRGVALVDPMDASGRWFTASAGFGVAWPMAEHARVVGTFEVGVSLARPRFILAEGGDIYSPAAATARCSFGLEVGWR